MVLGAITQQQRLKMYVSIEYQIVSIDQLTVRYFLNENITCQYVLWANQTIESGLESNELYALAYLEKPYNFFEVYDLYQEVLNSLDISPPNPKSAIVNFSIEICNSLNSKLVSTHEAVYILYSLHCRLSQSNSCPSDLDPDLLCIFNHLEYSLELMESYIFPKGCSSHEDVIHYVQDELFKFQKDVLEKKLPMHTSGSK